MFIKMPDKEWGLVFLEDIDLEAQMAAVRSLIRRNREADIHLEAEIDALEAQVQTLTDYEAQIAEQIWVGQMQHSVFQDAANSMAAVGMVAPMFEALFTNLFAAMGREATPKPVFPSADDGASARQRRANADRWDPHVVFDSKGRREDLVAGIQQLAVETGLEAKLPGDYGKVITGLFLYRNMMFHNGFEWPVERRAAFASQIKSQGLPENWFRSSFHDHEPWIYYMTSEFVDRCLKLVDEVLAAIGGMTKPQSKMADDAADGAEKA
ncbi:hypothetical protein NI456_11180 [Brevundimonas diminuta]|uniref:hypothetical protein n=1 Tax=Brevundimonas diminuta TaxID=293 RepID=UPI00209801AB|nr:hypothetical protein [Brevundimonas diminuta]MCO8019419.1 hypothetical protein [Brevundimonas diminuta]MCO8022097.1 hypothetical protein [Brevundimonas diminuta]